MLNTKTIGKRIGEARKKMNVSQAQLAQRLFISSQAVGKWERGESMPDIITLNRLAEILGVDLNYFSESMEPVSAEKSTAEFTERQSVEPRSENQAEKPRWDLSRGHWVDADFSGLKNLHEKFSSSHLKNCKFIGSDLSGLLLSGNSVDGCDFSSSDISHSHVKGSELSNNQFKNCMLKESEFSGSHVQGCDFSNANLEGAKFKSSAFVKSTVANATWNRTTFTATQIADVVFEGTLEDCSFENCSFSRVTFQNATIKNTFFKNSNLKRVKFIDCQADRITYAFLKNGKADLTGIALLES